jgi:hypothetical protein
VPQAKTACALAPCGKAALSSRSRREENIDCYFVSLWLWCLRQRGQNFESASFSAFARLFFVVV